jgi:hypothetical protein
MLAEENQGRLEVEGVPLSHRGPLAGTGTLHDGAVALCRIRYRLTVLRRFTRGTDGKRVEVAPSITGELRDLENACDLGDLFERQVVLTLELADGQLFDCVLQDADGRVVAAGRGLREPAPKSRGGRRKRS